MDSGAFLLCVDEREGSGSSSEMLLLKMPSAYAALDKTALPPQGIAIPAEPSLEESSSISEHQNSSKANESVLLWFSFLMHFHVKGPKCSFNSSGPAREAKVSFLPSSFQTSLQKAP